MTEESRRLKKILYEAEQVYARCVCEHCNAYMESHSAGEPQGCVLWQAVAAAEINLEKMALLSHEELAKRQSLVTEIVDAHVEHRKAVDFWAIAIGADNTEIDAARDRLDLLLDQLVEVMGR